MHASGGAIVGAVVEGRGITIGFGTWAGRKDGVIFGAVVAGRGVSLVFGNWAGTSGGMFAEGRGLGLVFGTWAGTDEGDGFNTVGSEGGWNVDGCEIGFSVGRIVIDATGSFSSEDGGRVAGCLLGRPRGFSTVAGGSRVSSDGCCEGGSVEGNF